MYIADLHIHSKYSRATSKTCVPEELDLWARRKGIGLIGTGDFTHPAWRELLAQTLVPAQEGLYVLREGLRLPAGGPDEAAAVPRFVLSGKSAQFIKRTVKRARFNVILLPSLAAADALARRLEAVGNIHSDGRPILGPSTAGTCSKLRSTCARRRFLFRRTSGRRTFPCLGRFPALTRLQSAFEDLTPHIHALETGCPPTRR